MGTATMASAGRPRRVLIVVHNLPVPFDRRVWLEATTLARAGYQVSVICPKARGFTRSFEVLEDVHRARARLPRPPRPQPARDLLAAWPVLEAARPALPVRPPRPLAGDVPGQVRYR